MICRAILPAVALVTALLPLPCLQAQNKPIPAKEAPGKMTLPEGFHATLFAGEPDVVQPIAFCFDDRGRLWVAECYSYPKWLTDPKQGKDRVLIFEDTDGDGKFDKRTVFADKLANLSGIQYGFGGIWLCASPNLLFIPDRNGDDVPDGPPEVVLDGWSLKAQHNVFNSLTWGPDGWLYGCNGIVATSRVGAPGTPDKDRVPMNCGVWRYHPTKKKFESVASGTTNPWGLDFDEYGEMFITNCVIDHLWHVVPGAHYQRMYGEDLTPHVYKLMPSICDHLHWGGGHWTDSRAPANSGKVGSASHEKAFQVHSDAGGGHAHVGCMIYLGDNWPARYRGGAFMCNLHGNRINHDILERNGSTYVARHGKDFMLANDPWFRGIALQYGPDGGVYVSDWTDTGECHNYKDVDQSNGRIYKIEYQRHRRLLPDNINWAKVGDFELLQLHREHNEWYARHARRILQERASQGKLEPDTVLVLWDFVKSRSWDSVRQLRGLWSLHAVNALTHDRLLELLDHYNENVRAWAVRFLLDDAPFDEKTATALQRVAQRDASRLVRLHLAGGLQRLNERVANQPEQDARLRALVDALVTHADDTSDPYLPLMYWYAAVPHASRDLLSRARIPLVREYLARRLTVLDRHADALGLVRKEDDPVLARDVLRGIQEGLSGRRTVNQPNAWIQVFPVLMASPLPEVRERALGLAVQFGDKRAFTLLRETVADPTLPVKERDQALKTLVFQQQPDLVPVLHGLLRDDALRSSAILGLASFDDLQAPALLLQGYSKWNAAQRSDVIQTLSSRPKYALALLDALEKQTIPRADINSYTIRQLQALKSPEVSAKLTKLWGEIRPASAEKAKLMAKYKGQLRPETLKKANLASGRALYQKACASCHRLFGEGGAIGPDLTGSQRTNLDYILENVLDPSAIVPREYQVTLLTTTSGRTLSGIVKKETDAAVTVQTQNELLVLPRGDIESRTQTKVSMMPEGLFEQLRPDDVRDLVGYLMGPGAEHRH